MAQARDSNSRSAFLAEACQGDVECASRGRGPYWPKMRVVRFWTEPAAWSYSPNLPASQTPDPLSAGDKLGPYEIVAFVGAGGMVVKSIRRRIHVCTAVSP